MCLPVQLLLGGAELAVPQQVLFGKLQNLLGNFLGIELYQLCWNVIEQGLAGSF